MILQAPAKINLGLEVLRRRDDGFHDVNTIYAAVDLCDEITLTPRNDDRIVCVVQGDARLEGERSEDNLCVRAAHAIRKTAHMTEGLNILLHKRIPTGAGLGGGSSDAAAVLSGAVKLWGLDSSVEDLLTIASQLGSDVPFFLRGGAAHATSRGEVLTPLDLSIPWTLLLVNPGIHIPTPHAYEAVNRIGHRPASDLVGALRAGIDDPSSMRAAVVNDFEEAIFSEYPLLGGIKARLYELGAFFALMSGSGSTLFGLFEDHRQACAAATRFKDHWHRVLGFR